MDCSERIKVTHIRTSHGVFGAERVILGLLGSADRKRFDVHVTLIASERGLNREFVEAVRGIGVEVDQFLFKGRFDLSGAGKLREHLRARRIRIIHCHDFKSNFYGILATLGTDIRRITTHHGSTKDDALLRLYLHLNERVFVRMFHGVIVVSEALMNEPWARAVRDKVTFIANGIDTGFMNAESGDTERENPLPSMRGKRRIGIVGRLFPDKGHEILFKSMDILKDEFPDAVILVIGDGPLRDRLEKMRDRMGLKERIAFSGIRRDMGKVYGSMDVFAMPSLREGLPMAMLEAMLAGVPVVGTRVGGMPDLLGEGKRGRAVNANDAEELAREIGYVFRYPEESRRMATNASRFVKENYSSDAMARRTEEFYLYALSGKRM